MLIIMGILLLLILLALFGFAFFFTLNVFTLLGAILVIIGGIGLLRGFVPNIAFTLIGIGIGLIVLPILSNKITGITLATIMP